MTCATRRISPASTRIPLPRIGGKLEGTVVEALTGAGGKANSTKPVYKAATGRRPTVRPPLLEPHCELFDCFRTIGFELESALLQLDSIRRRAQRRERARRAPPRAGDPTGSLFRRRFSFSSTHPLGGPWNLQRVTQIERIERIEPSRHFDDQT